MGFSVVVLGTIILLDNGSNGLIVGHGFVSQSEATRLLRRSIG